MPNRRSRPKKALLTLADADFSPAYLRNATAYGHSPMLRIDLVVNNLLACAVAKGDIRIMSDGTPWRPLIHCKDIARAFVAFLEAPRAAIHNQRVNVGGDAENYQVQDIAAIVQRLVPGTGIVYTGEVGKDPRDYRVDFARLGKLLPDFRLEYTLAAGMEELLSRYPSARLLGGRFRRRPIRPAAHPAPSPRQGYRTAAGKDGLRDPNALCADPA